jgi:hypothetical protein
MKKVILIFSTVISVLFYSCKNECAQWKQDLTAQDSIILMRYKKLISQQVLPPQDSKNKTVYAGAPAYSMDDTKTMIDSFMSAPAEAVADIRGSIYLSDSLLLAMAMNGPVSATGIWVHRGIDADGRTHWLAWECVPEGDPDHDNVSAYELPAISCMCKPCCGTATQMTTPEQPH